MAIWDKYANPGAPTGDSATTADRDRQQSTEERGTGGTEGAFSPHGSGDSSADKPSPFEGGSAGTGGTEGSFQFGGGDPTADAPIADEGGGERGRPSRAGTAGSSAVWESPTVGDAAEHGLDTDRRGGFADPDEATPEGGGGRTPGFGPASGETIIRLVETNDGARYQAPEVPEVNFPEIRLPRVEAPNVDVSGLGAGIGNWLNSVLDRLTIVAGAVGIFAVLLIVALLFAGRPGRG